MSGFDAPIKDRLRDVGDEPTLARMWTRIQAGPPPAGSRRRLLPTMVLATAGTFACVALLVGYLGRDRGPLRLSGGHPVVSTVAAAGGTLLMMSDGSRIELGPGTRFEPVESSGSLFVAVVANGTAAFDVHPGGPRRWQIECGLATVEVVGTRFSCERTPDHLRVAVARGAVLVRGERIPDRVRRLTAGQALDVAAGPAAPAAVPAQPAVAPVPRTEPAPAAAAGPSAGGWRDLARRGRHQEAFASLPAGGIAPETKRLGIADLFALADVARLSGHPADAVAPLDRIQNEFADDSQAPLAAFALGRLELDTLGRPDRAAAAFRRALKLGIPHSLREDVRARLVEAYVRAGDRAAATSAARAYTREFASGRYADRIKALTQGQ
ncbi:MAG TPA: FecR family protein [Polyangia bacterium]|jgi:transmembrane sensor|nr:FecR family protein [Polyangia bacterium]